MTEQNLIQISAKLYECRDTARRLLGDKYHDRMEAYGKLIQDVMDRKKCNELKAGMLLAQHADGMVSIMVFAATVELIEPCGQ